MEFIKHISDGVILYRKNGRLCCTDMTEMSSYITAIIPEMEAEFIHDPKKLFEIYADLIMAMNRRHK